MADPEHVHRLRLAKRQRDEGLRPDAIKIGDVFSLLSDYDRLIQLVSDAAGVVRPFAEEGTTWERNATLPDGRLLARGQSGDTDPFNARGGGPIQIGHLRAASALLPRLEKEIGNG